MFLTNYTTMDSGIYRLTFTSNHYYIGKSENIPKRWETHRRNFLQGTHTKRMQWAYNHWGMPKFEVILTVHPDHLDLYENLMIQECWFDGKAILNGTKPKPIPEHTAEKLHKAYDTTVGTTKLMHLSTVEQVDLIWQLYTNNQVLETELEECKDEQWLVELNEIYVEENHKLSKQVQQLQQELEKLKHQTRWQHFLKCIGV